MWHIDLIDIVGNGLIVGFDTNVDTLDEAELIVSREISKHIGCHNVHLAHEDDLVYEVWSQGESIGCIHIRSL